jgi:hypothetical protein
MQKFLAVLFGLSLGAWAEWPHQPADQAQLTTFKPEIAVQWPLGTNLPVKSARLFLDDLEVTKECLRNQMFLSFRPTTPLRRGPHQVRVEVADQKQSWSFEVIGTKLIETSVLQLPPGKLEIFDKIEVELKGVPRGKAWAEIVGFPETYKLKEGKRGYYRGQFKLPAKVAGHTTSIEVFLEKDGDLDRQVVEGKVSLAAIDLKLDWLSPAAGAKVDSPVEVEGKTVPGARVDIVAKAFFKDGVEFGKLPPPTRAELKADAEGKFRFTYEFPKGIPRLGVLISATAMDEAENRSPASNLILFLGPRSALPPLRQ